MSVNEQPRIGGRETPTRPEIVVGIDESQASAAALRWAADHSRATGLPLRLVRTWQMSAMASAAVTSGAGEYFEAAAADARAHATRWVLDTLGGDAARINWTLEIHEGGAGPVLVAAARSAALVVVGTREHTGLRRVATGSVSHYVLSHTDVPVVSVPAPAEQAPDDSARGALALGPLY